MDVLGWVFMVGFWVVYLVCLFTVCALTFRKGHTVLGIVGIFFPVLWLVGAILPAKRGSRHDVEQAAYYQAQMADMTR